MKETIQYMDTLPNFVRKKPTNCGNIQLIEQFMRNPHTIMQIDITGKYKSCSSAAASWIGSIRRTGYRISVKSTKHEDREYIFLIKDSDGTATL